MNKRRKFCFFICWKSCFSSFLLFLLIASLGLWSNCSPQKPETAPNRERDPQYHYEKALVAMRYELEDMAINFLQQALTLDPNHYPSYNLLGVIYHKKKDYQAALQALNRAIELKPNSAEAHHNLGVVYQDMGMFDRAEGEYRKAIMLGYHQSLFLLARLLFDQKKYEEAIQWALKAAEINPNDPGIFNLLGVACNERRDYKLAINYLRQAMDLNPHDPIIWINLGVAYLNNGEKELAKELLEKALTRLQDPALIDKVKSWLDQIKF